MDITVCHAVFCIAMALPLSASSVKQAVIYFAVSLFCRLVPSRGTMKETEIVMGSDITGESHFC